MTELHLRALSAEERLDVMFRTKGPKWDINSYKLAVQRMQLGVAYSITLNGITARATSIRFNRAAKLVNRKLRWATVAKDAKELYVELVG